MAEILLVGGLVATPQGAVAADVRLAGEIVAEVGPGLDRDCAEVVDCTGCWVGPGLVDPHVHLREPGQEWKEDIESGSQAAVAGGFTAVVAMPNTDPPIDAGHLARFVAERGRQVGLVDVSSAGCVTAGRAGQRLAHLDELWAAGVRLFTDDGDSVADAGLLRRAMEYLSDMGGVVAQHAEDRGLAGSGQLHEGEVSALLGMVGIPAEAEEVVVARDLAIARLTGARYHVQHVSTAGTVALVRAAKGEGLAVTAEATPHHLAFDHHEVLSTDPAFKMYPPLRRPPDVEAVRAALADGTIDMVGTDHAPHAAHEKDVPFEEAPRGVIGLETAVGAVLGAVALAPEDFFARLAVAPAGLAGLGAHGHLPAPGSPATITVVDPAREWVAGPFRSRSSNSPWRGRRLTGRARHVLLRGRFTLRDEELRW
ncbi:MAG TPA: dihydroorotase [Acidimicrobiia bacterium]|nr:dihydroorotase [Acidimicrobiia bacterium]